MTSNAIFITGGAGFIGRWLVARCLEQGLKVAIYDNLCAGTLENIKPFLDQIDFFEADILDRERLLAAIEATVPDTVFHLAAHHFIPFCNDHPLEALRVNVLGTYCVLDAAARSGVKTIVVASTGAIYPNQDGPLSEDLMPVPVNVYGLSKVLCEEIARFFANTTSLRCVVARLFNTYGPYETNPHLIPHIMASLHEGPRVELGNVHTKRDYIYVEDVANLLLQCAKTNGPQCVIVNVGTGREYSAEQIIAEISSLMGTEIEIVIAPERVRAVDKLHQIADITRLERLTGCRPQYSLREGLRKLLVHEGLLP